VHEPTAALSRILSALDDVAPLPPERVTLHEALGRALAEDVVARGALPPFDCAQMDGYALRAADAQTVGTRLPVAFEVFAGSPLPPELPPGTCCRIYTGAPLPPGADSVEMQEEVQRRGRWARFARQADPGRFLRKAGSDVRAGQTVLPRGRVLDPGGIGLAAALGRSELAVHRRPRVALLATGDEIAAIDQPPRPGQILDSNSHALAAACIDAGAVPTLLPIARDSRHSLQDALGGVKGHDVLVSSGGVSVGARDLVRDALGRSGARLDFWRVAMRPGKPIAFGRLGAVAVFGLPGNPASALVTFELFVRPALRRLAALPGTGRTVILARSQVELRKAAGLTHYLRVRVQDHPDGPRITPLRTQTSGDLSSVTGFEGIAILPKAATRIRRGDRLEVILVAAPTEGSADSAAFTR
jgi:molybdopterin molybdotransferase